MQSRDKKTSLPKLASTRWHNIFRHLCIKPPTANTCARWWSPASYGDILMVTTVVYAPAVVWTQRNVCFRTITGNIVQPNRSVSRINVSKRHSVVPVRSHQPENFRQIVTIIHCSTVSNKTRACTCQFHALFHQQCFNISNALYGEFIYEMWQVVLDH